MVSIQSITMYARERFCPDVARTRGRLEELGLTWTEHDIEADAGAARLVQALTGQRRVPTLVVGSAVLVEPTNDQLDATLRNAGFEVEEAAELGAR